MKKLRLDKEKPITLVDMDGVLVSLLPAWLEVYHDVGGELLWPADITEYDFEKQVENPKLFKQVLDSAIPFYIADPETYALLGFDHLRNVADVRIVTTVMPGNSRAYGAKLGWIWRHIHPRFDPAHVNFVADKTLIDAQFLIEDSPKNIERWLERHPQGHGIIVDQTYNQGYTHERCTRVWSLVDAAELIEEMSK